MVVGTGAGWSWSCRFVVEDALDKRGELRGHTGFVSRAEVVEQRL